MKRIAVTQRVETFYGGTERRDCLDQRWTVLLRKLDAVPLPLPNVLADPVEYLSQSGADCVVLSGGNDLAGVADPGEENSAPERDATERAIIRYCIERRLPLFGVCRGMQAINLFLGGQVARVTGHAGGRHSVVARPGCERDWPPQFEVNSYHNFGIPGDGLAQDLEPMATSAEDGTIEAFRHRSANCVGVMWHPEREPGIATHDLGLLRRILAA